MATIGMRYHVVDNAERSAEQNAVPVMQEIWENAK